MEERNRRYEGGRIWRMERENGEWKDSPRENGERERERERER